jgi:hypothetical protein
MANLKKVQPQNFKVAIPGVVQILSWMLAMAPKLPKRIQMNKAAQKY